ncbi:hypothetical protein [Lichenicoccus roseus]|uniref:Uncharacterized protein n=1 Tax=Lichenicoccus roseus TaxID=2683649 RepID=A0A5R9IYX5_9PROT|nr:hypothetical protein [Lichenicoccus roseus]TLU70675.1 hypothetical protein FE263_21035 [Lichenicoccus roseus]
MTSAAAADFVAQEIAESGEALCLPDTDWLQHRLTISGPVQELARFRSGAAGAGVIPWQIDFEQLQEDWFHRLMAAPARILSAQGARILAQQLREASERRHALAVAQVGRSRACPFDLHALRPVPGSILALGPDHPEALAWLWQHLGTTQALRHVVVLGEPREQEAAEATWRLGFWAADWTPWRALSAIAYDWPQLRFKARPLYDQAA